MSHLCPVCETLMMSRVDDEEWLCFSCGYGEIRRDDPVNGRRVVTPLPKRAARAT